MSMNPTLAEIMRDIQMRQGIDVLAEELSRWSSDNLKVVLVPKVDKKPHITEQKYPEQTKMFREILDEMYQTHLAKNADYSAWNINGTGLIGLTVRFWDKTARLMNLIGFDIGTGQYTGEKKNHVSDESIIDTVRDAGVYSIIFRIFVAGKWGR